MASDFPTGRTCRMCAGERFYCDKDGLRWPCRCDSVPKAIAVEGMSYDEYDALPGIRSTRLNLMGKSALHYHANYTGEDTTSRAVLRAIHAAVLEPAVYATSFAVCDVTRNKAHNAYKDWLAEHGDKTALTRGEADKVQAVADAILGHSVARHILSQPGPTEYVIQWTDAATGLLCKARVDKVWQGRSVDLKGYGTTDMRLLAKHVLSRGAHVQAAHFTEALAAADGGSADDRSAFLIVYETSPPYDVGVVELAADDAVLCGRNERARLLDLIAKHEDSGEWPGRMPMVQQLTMPPWAWGDIEITELQE